MTRLLIATAFAACLLGGSASAAEKVLDYELSRAYQVLERGQENRARILFRDYLKRHPDNAWALEGYEAAGGDMDKLPRRKPAPTPAPKAVATAEAVAEEHAPEPVAEAEAQEPSPLVEEAAAPEGAVAEAAPTDAVIELKPESKFPAWAKEQWQKLKRLGWFVLLGLGVLLAVAGVVALAVLGVRFSAWHERKRTAQLEALAASSAENVYVEYRHWAPWWGLGLDSEAASNQVLARFNQAGWTCLEARREWGGLFKLPFIQILLVILVQSLTLGFMRFYTGTNFLFKRGAVPALHE